MGLRRKQECHSFAEERTLRGPLFGRHLFGRLLFGQVLAAAIAQGAPAGTEPKPRAEDSTPSPAAPEAEELSRRTEPARTKEKLPPPDLAKLRHAPPSPQFDVGLQLGVCGVGASQLWAGTDFCGGVIVDALFLRRRSSAPGLGPYLALGTSGFFDMRASAGLTGFAPITELLGLQGRVGPLLLTAADGVQGGLDADVEILLRGLSSNGHYAMAHGLSIGVQHAPGSLSRAGTTILIQLRLDALWLIVPTTWLR